jgi:hypothetical protein
MSDDAVLTLVREAEKVGRSIDGLRVTLAGEVAERSRPTLGSERLCLQRGCRNPAEVIERAALVSGQTARARLHLAARLRPVFTLAGDALPGEFPAVREALADGTLSTDAATAIVSQLAPLVDRGQVLGSGGGIAAAERELVGAAVAGDSADEVRLMAQTWALFLDQDGTLPDEHRGRRERGLHLGRERHGTVPVRGALLPEVAAQLRRLLDAYLNPKVADGPRFIDVDAGDKSPDTARSDHALFHDDAEQRSPAQKRHDALAGILTVAASHDDSPRLGGAAPTLVVVTTPDQLAATNGTAFLHGDEGDRTPVASAVARHVGCAGAVQQLVLSAGGRVIQLGSPQRIFTPHQRRAITVRDGGCVIPGCRVPATWCEVHHVAEHSRGGPTHIDNGVLLCWHHHRTIDTGGWEIEMRRGIPWVRPPGWIDVHRRWRPGGRSAFRAWSELRARDEMHGGGT